MPTPDRRSAAVLPDSTYIELVASLCGTRLPASIMSGLFVLIATLAVVRTGDAFLRTGLAVGVFVSTARLGVLFGGRRLTDAGTMTLPAARSFEAAFAITYLAFATLLGGFAARVFMLPMPILFLPVAVLVVGYGAGVAAVTGLRPRIAVPSLVLATAPTIIVIALRPGIEYLASAISLGALLVGGLRSLDRRYRNEVAMATMRQTFVRLARRDHLTGLNNRLGLVEALVGLRAQHGARRRIAVHYLDLDGFKPVNDQLGHQAGDVLLCLVAERLRTAAAPNHIVARLGGDEFAFVQTDAASNTDIAAQALHIEAVLGLPFRVGDRPVVVGTSVGSSQLADADIDIEELLYEADIALRARKIERKARAERYWAEERDPLIGAM